MSFTVRDLFELDVMQSAVLVAGAAGLDNEIKFANVMETPEVAKFMKGGEFLISAGFALSDNPADCQKLIREFAEKRIAAFGINTGRYMQTIPAAMIEEADRWNLPLMILPKNVPYMDIMVPVWNRTISQRVLATDRSTEFYNILLDTILSERGIVGVSNTLAMLTNNPVFLLDASCNLMSGSVSASELRQDYGFQLSEIISYIQLLQIGGRLRIESEPQRFSWQPSVGSSHSLLIMPVLVNHNLNGYLFILEMQQELTAEDVLALADTGTIIALEMLKEKAVFDVQRRVQGELLEDLLSGYYRDRASLERHLKGMDFATERSMVMLFVDIRKESGESPSSSEAVKPYDLKSKLVKAIGEYAHKHCGGAILSSRSDCVICLLALAPNAEPAELERLPEYLTGIMNVERLKAIGVSDVFADLGQVRVAYEQAKIAAKAKAPSEWLQLINYREMGIYLLLNEIKELPAARSFCQLHLQSLIDYDRGSGELLKTLEAYFTCNGNLRLTADQLYVHKNSVAYRLNKVKQLTGLDINRAEDRFNLELALHLWRLMTVIG